MYKIQNKVSGATSQVTDSQWEDLKAKKITEDPNEKKSWASKYKVLEYQPDIESPAVNFTPPEIAMPEINLPPSDKETKSKSTKAK